MFLKSVFQFSSVSNLDPSPSTLVKNDRALFPILTDSYITPSQAFPEHSCYDKHSACLHAPVVWRQVLIYAVQGKLGALCNQILFGCTPEKVVDPKLASRIENYLYFQCFSKHMKSVRFCKIESTLSTGITGNDCDPRLWGNRCLKMIVVQTP